jgi:two-component system sensor histidine kinase MprB
MLNRLTLQGRFALMAALAVSIAVVAAAVISYFLVEGQLSNQVDVQLTGVSGAHQPANVAGAGAGSVPGPGAGLPGSNVSPAALMMSCQDYAQNPKANQPGDLGLGFLGLRLGRAGSYIVSSTGSICSVFPEHGDLGTTASAAQIAVADGQSDRVFYDTYTTTGDHVRVYTEYSGQKGYAYSSVVSLSHMDSSLHSLAIGLLFASLGGILLAGAAGFLVARSVLKPVRRLTRAAEHVVATDDLSFQLPVEGADELSRLGKAFNRMTRSLAGSRERQQRLIADAGHELRTPLTSLRANVDLLLRARRTGRQLPPGREQSMLESLDQQLHELSGLVADLLELSRNAEGGRRRTMRVALHDSVGRAVERAKLRGPGLEFDVEIDEPWFVEGDPTGVDRAVVNLLDNAVKFSPPGGVVTVRLSRGEYSVRDQGPGIDASDLPRVLERFYRSDSARQLPGSGLGLAIVAQVAEETGGRIALEPGPGGGTIARLTLPGDPGTDGAPV